MFEIERPGRPNQPPRRGNSTSANEANGQSRAGLKTGSGRLKIIRLDAVFDLDEVESCGPGEANTFRCLAAARSPADVRAILKYLVLFGREYGTATSSMFRQIEREARLSWSLR